MDYVIKRASALTAEEKSILNLTGIPDNWPVEAYQYADNIPDGFELITAADFAQLKIDHRNAYDSWLISITPAVVEQKTSATSTDIFETSAHYPTFAIIKNFVLVPPPGRYTCFYHATSSYSASQKTHYIVIYKNGIQLTDSLRKQDSTKSGQNFQDSTQADLECNGTDQITIGVSCDNAGTLSTTHRTIAVINRGT